MGKKIKGRGLEPPKPEVSPAERKAELATRLMGERLAESHRLAEAYAATRDPRERTLEPTTD